MYLYLQQRRVSAAAVNKSSNVNQPNNGNRDKLKFDLKKTKKVFWILFFQSDQKREVSNVKSWPRLLLWASVPLIFGWGCLLPWIPLCCFSLFRFSSIILFLICSSLLCLGLRVRCGCCCAASLLSGTAVRKSSPAVGLAADTLLLLLFSPFVCDVHGAFGSFVFLFILFFISVFYLCKRLSRCVCVCVFELKPQRRFSPFIWLLVAHTSLNHLPRHQWH